MPKSIQQMLDAPNADYDPNSPASQARRAEFTSDPIKDIRSYISKYQHPSLNDGIPTADQEALQAPTVDPVFLVAGGLTSGISTWFGDMAAHTARNEAILTANKAFGDVINYGEGPNATDFMKEMADQAREYIRLPAKPSIIDHIRSFVSGAGGNMTSNAAVQTVLNNHPDVAKVGGLPAGDKLSSEAIKQMRQLGVRYELPPVPWDYP